MKIYTFLAGGLLVLLTIWNVAEVVVAGENLVHDFRGFDDTILYDIDWTEEQEFNPDVDEKFVITGDNQVAEYSCLIPKMESRENESKTLYSGPTPFELVAGLFGGSVCSFRVESYWTYEVCHGNYIKQYHEEREGKSSKVQEYILGRWSKLETEQLRVKLAADPSLGDKPKLKKVEGMSLPYLAVDMSNGTPCSLIDNKPRTTRVLYVCFAHAKIDVYSVKEVSTCQYEVVILTQVLCSHPSFQPNAIAENRIKCSPTSAATPVKPTSNWHPSFQGKDDPQVLDPRMFEKVLNNELEKLKQLTSKLQAIELESAFKHDFGQFLGGDDCLVGGTGFWRYELCFSKYVRRFHKNKAGDEKESVVLGRTTLPELDAWMLAQQKAPKTTDGGSKSISYTFLNGDKCPSSADKARRTEVILKCVVDDVNESVFNAKSAAAELKMYMLEPLPCEHVLTVETKFACFLIQQMDEKYRTQTVAEIVN